jgi:redox-sensitive bicupin YhaK (pirin superfamily)
MIDKRSFESLGKFRNDWLDAKYHFSFAEYRDPARVHWGALRVWNDDKIDPKTGFSPHSHADMEIITYVREGAITHEDSMGNRGRTKAGDVQVMSAGSGVRHSEFNLEDRPTRLFQIWIVPNVRGGAPSWGAAKFPKSNRSGKFVALASGYEADLSQGALPIRQEARVLGATVAAGEAIAYPLAAGRHAYLVLAKGAANVNGEDLDERDGAAIKNVDVITVTARAETEIVLVDAP